MNVYHTKKGKLRAKLKVNNRVHSVKCGEKTQSIISMPVGFTSFVVVGIKKDDLGQTVTIQTIPSDERIELTPTQSEFI